MKKVAAKILLTLMLICLVGIGVMVASSFLKEKTEETLQKDIGSILGQKTETEENPEVTPSVDKVIQETFQSKFKETTKEVEQKVVEVEKNIVQIVEKEMQNLSGSQIDALKLQICKDLGVISPEPTKEEE